MSWGNTRMNSNGVGVVSLCFFTTIFMKAGKEVWNWSSSFCPQPSWMKINSFVQQGLKPEQRHTSQNVKLTSKREKFFLQFLGKPQSMPHVCASKKGTPRKAVNQMCSKSCFVKSFAQERTHKVLLEQSRGSMEQSKEIRKSLTKRPSSVSVEPFLRTWTDRTPTPFELSGRSLLKFFDFVGQNGEKQLSKKVKHYFFGVG